MSRRVAHSATKAAGTATFHTDRPFGPYDEQGPWSYVEFDDGLRCWVPDSLLTEVSE